MAKRKSVVPTGFSLNGYSSWDIKRTIREAENIARWNPWLAHAWMEEARNQLSLDAPFFKEYDEAVDRINERWTVQRNFIWYNESDFWNFNGEPREPALLTKTYE
jgi:hypothetical protein